MRKWGKRVARKLKGKKKSGVRKLEEIIVRENWVQK